MSPASAAAVLVLEDGTLFRGRPFGALGQALGQAAVFIGTTGYQAMLTDPARASQIVVAAAPHLGNAGWQPTDPGEPEWGPIQVRGCVVRDPAPRPARRGVPSLEDVLALQGVVGLRDLDTRALVRHLRDHGPLRGAIDSLGSAIADLVALLVQKEG